MDHSAACAARYSAKNVVAAGLADRVEVPMANAIGMVHPFSVNMETFGTAKIADGRTTALINGFFDLRPGAIIRDLSLRGHSLQDRRLRPLGRDNIEFPWERADKAEALKKATGW